MARKTPGKGRQAAAAQPPAPAPPAAREDGGLKAAHLLLVATLIGVAAGVFATRGTSAVNSIAIGVAIATVGLVAAAAARTIAPLVTPEIGEQTEMVGGRTRAALEREKMLVLRSIKEVEFDRAMGKISQTDFTEVAGRLRARAAGLLRQLDRDSSGYRDLIERDLATRVGATAAPVTGACGACGAANDADARFCKSCGARIEAAR
jgi:hypothetical protein